MNTFCGCNNPDIETKEEGMSVVVSCTNCGQSVVTTNTDMILEQNPWLGDDTEYEIYLDNNEIEKKVYIEIMKNFMVITSSNALKLYKNKQRVLIYTGKGQEFYKKCKYLNKENAKYETKPECNYIKST